MEIFKVDQDEKTWYVKIVR